MTAFTDEMHIIKEEEGIEEDAELVGLRDRLNIILAASESRFWKEFLIPELDTLIATFDELHQSEKDPYRRYALTEVYSAYSRFKLMLLETLDVAKNSITNIND